MKVFFARNFIVSLLIFFLLLFVVIYILYSQLSIKNLLHPSLNFLESETNTYTLKNLKKVSYGFLPYWSIGDFNYDFSTLTDLAYFTIALNSDGTIKKIDPETGNLDPSYNTWSNSSKLKDILQKSRESGVRNTITIAIHDNDSIEKFLNCNTCWVTSYKALNTEVKNNFILGLNFDFEYVGDPIDNIDLKYTEYITYLSKKFKSDYGKNFLIVVSVYADSAIKSRLMNIDSLNTNDIDYLFIMAYDFYRPTSSTSGPVAPIGGSPQKYEYDITSTNIDYLAKISPGKLILGLPFYGYNWIVESYEPYSARVDGNDYTGYSISQHYSAIKEKIESESIDVLWDEDAKSPYFSYYNEDTGVIRQVFFENQKSIQEKVDFAQKNNYAGVGIWALGYTGGDTQLFLPIEKYLSIDN
ncbi:hypothetical protein COV24_00075 [candidate division WWE3 bacterium CG10_big_fil_rev_8_21_14_0_10_32_10]|uniref:GH18 domain-containing protein n=1 Tax=candidate division WWE3 bacterium CG10_big_fil_rev_8_21_14_0_10_32_10 TaxID=1975090 RepID=A0A2H0RBM3_UNCKA|nr:MAG: hypothetical protein COV24_00075 [candidate division WWE3 bacterium CG10_big_fil_rev_8_21_14_0_10_32_10]